MAEDKLIRNRKMGLVKKQSNVFKIRRNSLLLFSIIFFVRFYRVICKEARGACHGLGCVTGRWVRGTVSLFGWRMPQSVSGEHVDGEDVDALHDLLHYKTGCWLLLSLCFASSHPRFRWSPLGQCSHPPVGGPQWWLWQSTTQSGVYTLGTWLLLHTRTGGGWL